MKIWLRRVRHDLVKPLVWPARDLADLKRPLRPADRQELISALDRLIDEAGAPVTATELWQQLRAAAPAGVPARDLDRFERALLRALAACRDEAPAAVEALLALEPALAALARCGRGGAP
ncbi:MAG: hypothetical protein JXR83_15745 [Deltaproteobacteria bacterium]|nr:hypothetical protein [Deltaproteobacteria bacterium]